MRARGSRPAGWVGGKVPRAVLISDLNDVKFTTRGCVSGCNYDRAADALLIACVSSPAAVRLEAGKRMPVDLKEGDRVLFQNYAGTEFKLDREDLLILSEKDVLALIEG